MPDVESRPLVPADGVVWNKSASPQRFCIVQVLLKKSDVDKKLSAVVLNESPAFNVVEAAKLEAKAEHRSAVNTALGLMGVTTLVCELNVDGPGTVVDAHHWANTCCEAPSQESTLE